MSALPHVHADPQKVTQSGWKDYGIRFLFGGIITAAVGIVGVVWGPIVAGLFLAFPAILPASLTLIGQHDGKRSAGLDACGAIIGAFGLLAFGLVIWLLARHLAAVAVLAIAVALWLSVSVGLWVAVTCLLPESGQRES